MILKKRNTLISCISLWGLIQPAFFENYVIEYAYGTILPLILLPVAVAVVELSEFSKFKIIPIQILVVIGMLIHAFPMIRVMPYYITTNPLSKLSQKEKLLASFLQKGDTGFNVNIIAIGYASWYSLGIGQNLAETIMAFQNARVDINRLIKTLDEILQNRPAVLPPPVSLMHQLPIYNNLDKILQNLYENYTSTKDGKLYIRKDKIQLLENYNRYISDYEIDKNKILLTAYNCLVH